MTVETLLQPLIYGLQIGVTYMFLALGLTVIFSIMNVINLDHGEFSMLIGLVQTLWRWINGITARIPEKAM